MAAASTAYQKSGGRIQPRDNVIRAATASVLAFANGRSASQADEILRSFWPDDPVSPLVLRAATTPATTSTAGWASQLAATAVSDYVAGLGPVSAASQLIRRSLQLTLPNRTAVLNVPSLVASAGGSGWVGESNPIAVEQYSTTGGASLTPKRLKSISVFTSEMVRSSNIEPLVRDVMTRSTGLALDATMFGTAAAGDAPAGIRNGVSATTASTATDLGEAMIADLRALGSAVSVVGGSDIAFVAGPAQALAIKLRAPAGFDVPIFASSALAGVVMAIALPALVVATEPVPRFETSWEAVLHMDDSAPAAISASGTIAAPARSLAQTDSTALKLGLTITWSLRAPGAIAWATVAW